MMNSKNLTAALCALILLSHTACVGTAEKGIVVPSPVQAEWQQKERIMFIHFGPATFQGREYDNWSSDISQMYMSKLNTDQWCEVARSWDAKMIVFVAKHCGGFCWWQTETCDYSVKGIPWKNGKGDLMKDLSASCKKYGLDLGVYVYPGDEQWGAGIGSGGITEDPSKQEEYNNVYRQQLRELLTRYGTIKEVWFDGNCQIHVGDILEQHATQAVIFQGEHATIRWVGNEDGFAPDPNWYTLNRQDLIVGTATAVHSDAWGDAYAPVEVDVPIQNHGGHKWFWGPGSDELLMPHERLMELYFNSVGRGSVLLLNASPDTTGAIPPRQAQRFKEFGEDIRSCFASPLATISGKQKGLVCHFPTPQKVNCTVLQEDLMKGQRVLSYTIEGTTDGKTWKILKKGTSVGNKKIDRFPTQQLSAVRVVVDECKTTPHIENFTAYCLPEEALRSITSEDATVVVDVWEYATYPTERWTEIELDLTPYVNSIGQYELDFHATGHDYLDKRPWGLEVKNLELNMYGSSMNSAVQQVEGKNLFIITRSQQTLDDFPTTVRVQVKSLPGKSMGEIRLRKIKYE